MVERSGKAFCNTLHLFICSIKQHRDLFYVESLHIAELQVADLVRVQVLYIFIL